MAILGNDCEETAFSDRTEIAVGSNTPLRAMIPLRAEPFTQPKALAAGRHNTNR
jgi:hypothetical protein